MTWYNKLQFTTMLLAVAGVAIDWRVGLWTAIGFGGASVVAMVGQLVCEHHIGNSSLRAPLRWGLLAMVAYWLLLLASLLYSSDLPAATAVLTLKAALLIFPLSLLLTDTHWLKAGHLRALGYALVLGLVGLFVYCCIHGAVRMSDGATLASVLSSDKFDMRHHAYSALYLCVALLVVYYELYTRWGRLPRWWRGLLLAVVPLFILYVIIVNSRAGMLVLYAVEVFCVLHFALTRRRWGWAVLLAVLLAGFTVGIEKAMPRHSNRVISTVKDMSSDVRLKIYKNDLDVSLGSPVVGYGAGDYRQELDENYSSHGMSYEFNAHNQYLETMLSIGFIGLAVLLFWLFWPLGVAFVGLRRGTVGAAVFWLVFMFTFCLTFNCMFESMLERQMGLLFFGPTVSLMLLIINTEQNKFGQLQKK